jgi:hypothetical protein
VPLARPAPDQMFEAGLAFGCHDEWQVGFSAAADGWAIIVRQILTPRTWWKRLAQ